MNELLQTTAEIAAAFAGFASVVVVFRRRQDVRLDRDTRVAFQSMLLGALFVVFFGLLPLVLLQLVSDAGIAYFYSSIGLLIYIVCSFVWGVIQRTGTILSGLPYFLAASTIAVSQIAALLRSVDAVALYTLGVFTLLSISGYAFYSLITFDPGDGASRQQGDIP